MKTLLPDIIIEKVDHDRPEVRAELVSFLAERETHNLFILGNLTRGFPQSHVYTARRGGRLVGAAGYYARPKGVCPFSTDEQVVRGLVRHVAAIHRPIEHLNAIGYVGRPALEEILSMGFALRNEPWQVFMEASDLAAVPLSGWPGQEKVRRVEPRDGAEVARLIRYLDEPDDDSPVRDEEVAKALLNPDRLVLEEQGRVVATASTNGLGLKAFQILGVATDPAHRGRGYARATCAELMRRLRAEGARQSVLFTGPENEPAQRCYRKLGFEITGEYCMAQLMSPGTSDSPRHDGP
jgi:RimJ/RimL family protein N-acetyltransferase